MVESAALPAGTVRIEPERAHRFARRLLEASGVPKADASLVADVLIRADLRGIRSHGVARLSYFLIRLTGGTINLDPQMKFSVGSPTTGILDADNAIGILAADRAMTEALTLAEQYGSGFVAVRNSSHFGYAGYWSERAMRQGCIGISLSNSGRRATPTFASQSLLGTNPLSVTIPGNDTDFFLDMATTSVAVGKIETALREGRSVPDGWTDANAPPPGLDENGVLDYSAPLLPLGGAGDDTGGHKGYGLSLMAELLCGALSGTGLQDRLDGADGHAPPAMGHFMGAIKVAGFRSPGAVADDMDATFELLRSAKKAPGRDRVFIHGEPETIAETENRQAGIPVTPPIWEGLTVWSERLGVDPL